MRWLLRIRKRSSADRVERGWLCIRALRVQHLGRSSTPMLIRSGRDRGDGAAPSTRFLPLLACLALVGALCIPNASGAQSLPQLPHLPQLPVGQGQQSASSPSPGVVDPSVPPDRPVEPVVLTGTNFPAWAVP